MAMIPERPRQESYSEEQKDSVRASTASQSASTAKRTQTRSSAQLLESRQGRARKNAE